VVMGKGGRQDTTISRDDLISKVRLGELTPADAESEARRLGLDPLASEPDPNKFDSMREAFWTLPMAVAWIAYRSPDAVRNWWQDYRKEFLVWNFREWRVGPDGPVNEGHFLESRPAATLSLLQMADAMRNNTDGLMSAQEAIEALWLAMQRGAFEATGVDEQAGRRVPISREQWVDLTCFEERGRDVVGAAPNRGHINTRYRDIALPAEAIRSLWPSRPKLAPILPELVKPEGSGYMPLYCAAQWIATQGGSEIFDPCDEIIWKAAYDQLLARIASDEIKVIGIRNGERQPVPGYHFAGCRVDYPFAEPALELLLSEDTYLSSCVFLDETHWLEGYDDSLENRRGRQWGRLMVLKADVAKCWPFEPPRSGAPGRPSSMYLVEAEFAARCQRNEVADTVKTESEILADWLKSEHPNSPPASAKAIRNRLREAYRQYKEARN